MLTLVVILIDIGILFNDLLFERNVIYWSGFVHGNGLQIQIAFRVDASKQCLRNAIPLGLKWILQFLAYEGQVVQLLQQNYLKVTSSVWPPLVKWLETSPAAVEHHLFFRNPEKKTS